MGNLCMPVGQCVLRANEKKTKKKHIFCKISFYLIVPFNFRFSMFHVPHFLTKTYGGGGGVLRKNNGENSILYLLKNAICDEVLSILCFLENGSYITLSLKNVSAFLRCATTGVWFLQLIWPHLVGRKENEIIFPGF